MVTIQAKGGLSKVQHGFTAKRSTMTNLLVTENIIANDLNNHHPLDIVSVETKLKKHTNNKSSLHRYFIN
jgi:hypothetical protein